MIDAILSHKQKQTGHENTTYHFSNRDLLPK